MKRMHQSKTRPRGGSNAFQANGLLIVLTTLFISGLVVGALCVRTAEGEVLGKMTQLFQNYTQVRSQQSMFQNFSNSFIAGAIGILLLYLLGLTAWGAPLILCIPAFEGMGIGMTSGTLYADYGWPGFGYSALIIVPGALISTIAILLSARESIRYSTDIFLEHCLLHTSRHQPFKNYSIKFLILLLLVAVAATIDMMTIQFLARLFPLF